MSAKIAEREERRLYQSEREQQQKEAQLVAQQQKKDRLAAEAVQQVQDKRLLGAEANARTERERSAWSTFLTAAAEASAPHYHRERQSVQEFFNDCGKDRYVRIDKIADSFGIAQRQVVDRLEQLLREGRIAGFFSNADLFVFVSDDELSDIATAVNNQQGAVSLENVTAICQKIIGD